MKKKLFRSALAFLVFAISLQAQQPAKIPKIGMVGFRPAVPGSGYDLFQREFLKLGYIEGKNIAFETRSVDNERARIPGLADELVRLKVDVIFTPSSNDALFAKNATKTIPIVFVSSGDPVAAGLVDSLARPGGNVTGFATLQGVLAGKRLELLKETVPKLSRVAVLGDTVSRSSSSEERNEAQAAARALGLQIHSMEVDGTEQFDGVFRAAVKARSDGLTVTSSGLINAHRKQIIDLAVKYRLPAVYPRRDWMDSGGLMSYGADGDESYKRVAVFVDKILKGTKPADIPVEQPKSFEFIINLKAAKQIGVTIPPNVLVRVQRVIR